MYKTIKTWLSYYLAAKTIYQVHSPLVYQIVLILNSNISKLSIQDDIEFRKVSLSAVASVQDIERMKSLNYDDQKFSLVVYPNIRRSLARFEQWQHVAHLENSNQATIDYGRHGFIITSSLLHKNYRYTLIQTSMKPWLKYIL